VEGTWGYFASEDPALLGVHIPDGAKEFSIAVKVSAGAPEAVENILKTLQEKERLSIRAKRQEKQIEEMKHTKIWKLYQGYRNLVERKKR
jgi:glycine cleavage system regulatory protein